MRQRSDFRHLERLRVRWAEVDLQHIVFNGHYLMYFDTAVAGYWRALALPYHDTMEALAGDFYVRKATVEYEGSARYDDVVDVGVRLERFGNSSKVFGCAVFRGSERLVRGELVYVFADPATKTSRPVPPRLRHVLEGFESGEPMLEVASGSWEQMRAAASPLRRAVFEDEQRIPMPMAEDAADASALHVVALNRLGLAVGTGRLLAGSGGEARIGRLAVKAPLRGAGIGRALVQALVDAARARGEREVVLSAAADATAFYRRLGFVERGLPFDESGLPHQEMLRTL